MNWGARVGVWLVQWSIANLQQTESIVLEANSITRMAIKLRIRLVAISYLPVVERPESFIRVLVSPKHQINTWRERHERCHWVKSYLVLIEILPYDWSSCICLLARRPLEQTQDFRERVRLTPPCQRQLYDIRSSLQTTVLLTLQKSALNCKKPPRDPPRWKGRRV